VTETAYLTADQLDAAIHGPDACPPGRTGIGWARNDDGSRPVLCAHSKRRIDPTTGLCGYHDHGHWIDRRPWRLRGYDGRVIVADVPAPAYPLLQADREVF
jgi:hypothetical protein